MSKLDFYTGFPQDKAGLVMEGPAGLVACLTGT